MTVKGRLLLLAPLLLVLALGCQKGNPNAPAKLTGTVKYKGALVTAGTITFVADKGGATSCPIKADGSYTATDLPVGELSVSIETESANTNKKMPEYGGGRGGAHSMSPTPTRAGAGAVGGAYVKIPSKYAAYQTSGLKVTVTKGENHHDFDLTD